MNNQSQSRVLRYACSDTWLIPVWIVWLMVILITVYQWNGDGIWVPVWLVVLSIVTTLVTGYFTIARRAWRIMLSRSASISEKMTALRIAWEWRNSAIQIFDQVRDKSTGAYWLPGLRGFKLCDDGLHMFVLLPRLRYRQSALSDPADDGTMVAVLGVASVQYIGRTRSIVEYLVIPTDVTEDIRYAGD